jgi:hypothetical protein
MRILMMMMMMLNGVNEGVECDGSVVEGGRVTE